VYGDNIEHSEAIRLERHPVRHAHTSERVGPVPCDHVVQAQCIFAAVKLLINLRRNDLRAERELMSDGTHRLTSVSRQHPRMRER